LRSVIKGYDYGAVRVAEERGRGEGTEFLLSVSGYLHSMCCSCLIHRN